MSNNFKAEDIKKILGNKDNCIVLLKLSGFDQTQIKEEKKKSAKILYEEIANNFSMKDVNKTARKMFKEIEKYKSGLRAYEMMKEKLAEWNELGLGEIKWPCGQNDFDKHTQSINNRNTISSITKDEMIAKDAIKFRRIKEINTLRNDFIETTIFNSSDEVTPTLKHTGKGDFYVKGVKYDQKVAKSIGSDLSKLIEKGEITKDDLINNPIPLLKWMYENQGEDRFDSDKRLYVIFLDPQEECTIGDIEKSIESSDILNKSYKFTFKYGKGEKEKDYETEAKLILIRKHNI